jgi:hypothetical protein
MALQAKRIRLKADAGKKTSEYIQDVFTSSTPELWRGNDVRFEVGLFLKNVLITDISNINSLTLEVKTMAALAGAPVMTKTVAAAAMDASLSAETWADSTKQHALVEFSSAETNVDLGNNSYVDFWLVVSVVTTAGKQITIQSTILRIAEDGAGSAGAAPEFQDNHFTKGETDARYVQKHEDNAWTQFYNGRWYHYIESTALWYPEVAVIKDGIPILTLGEGVSL